MVKEAAAPATSTPPLYGRVREILESARIFPGRIPPSQQCVMVDVPDDDALVERHQPITLPSGWNREDSAVARDFGDEWLRSCRSLLLVVPSVVATLEFNVVVNPARPDFLSLKVSAPAPVVWDRRLIR